MTAADRSASHHSRALRSVPRAPARKRRRPNFRNAPPAALALLFVRTGRSIGTGSGSRLETVVPRESAEIVSRRLLIPRAHVFGCTSNATASARQRRRHARAPDDATAPRRHTHAASLRGAQSPPPVRGPVGPRRTEHATRAKSRGPPATRPESSVQHRCDPRVLSEVAHVAVVL